MTKHDPKLSDIQILYLNLRFIPRYTDFETLQMKSYMVFAWEFFHIPRYSINHVNTTAINRAIFAEILSLNHIRELSCEKIESSLK